MVEKQRRQDGDGSFFVGVSYTYLLGCLRYREKHVKDASCCLQTCNSVVYVAVMGLVLGQSLAASSCVENFRPVPFTVFEIQGFKLKNKNDNNDKKNWRNGLFAISPMLVVQF